MLCSKRLAKSEEKGEISLSLSFATTTSLEDHLGKVVVGFRLNRGLLLQQGHKRIIRGEANLRR